MMSTKKSIQTKANLMHHRFLTLAAVVLLGIGTGLVALMLGASIFGMPMFYSYIASPLVVLLNILPPLFLTLFVYWASGRAWVGFVVPAVIFFALAVVNYFKMQIRYEPFVFSDFQLAGEAGDSLAGYNLIINWKIWVAVLYAAAGAVVAFIFFRYKPTVKTRLIGAVAVLLSCALLSGFLYTNDRVYASVKSDYDISPWSSAEKYIVRGFVYPFIHSIQDPATKLPPGFKKDVAAEVMSGFADDIIPESEKVNIVSVMLESYADLSVFDTIDFTADIYEPLHALREESISGSLVVNTFAGGTTDSERLFLTGFTKPGDFMTPVNTYIRYFKEQGYYTEGFHAGDSWYYNRKTVNQNMGFDNYYYLEDFQDSTRRDAYFFSKVIELYESRDTSRPYFGYNLSYQNHGPYDGTKTSDIAYVNKGNLTEASYNILNNYLEGVSDTTLRIADFIDYFRSRSEPVVVVLFGDHKPWLGNSHEVYRELHIDVDFTTEQGFYDFYTTPYIIWANDAAKAALDSNFTGDGGDFSPCFLMNRLFQACSWGGNAYMKVADEFKRHVTVVSTATGLFRENGVLTTELSREAAAVYENFRRIEFYWKNDYAD
ncbi:MAG: sulfatase-like hydrolase/transferase [Clostridiales bacterium]|nr:sulfatase-like hydrolase/transferase [Clostridiales bacterium]